METPPPPFVACELLLAITWNCLVSQQSEGSLAHRLTVETLSSKFRAPNPKEVIVGTKRVNFQCLPKIRLLFAIFFPLKI